MAVDVFTEIEIARPRGEVAAYAADVDNTTEWYENIKAVEWKTEPPLRVGSRVAFVANFLGRRLEYTYEIRELVEGERLVMSTEQGPFAMETTYAWADAGEGVTRMTLRNRGEPAGFKRVAGTVMAGAMRRANRKDLERLKRILSGVRERAVVLGDAGPAAPVAVAALLGDGAEPLPPAVLDPHRRAVAGGRERHLHLGRVGAIEAQVPEVDQPPRRIPGQHLAPVVLDPLRRALEDPPARARLERDGEPGLAGDRVAVRPPPRRLLRPQRERTLRRRTGR